MAYFTLLDQAEEDKLHATRLLSVEEKPFRRLTKRLLSQESPIQAFSSRLPTPPADETLDEDDTASSARHEKFLSSLQRFRKDVILDFAAFESSIARIQFLRAANEKERDRYAAEKVKIEATAQDVRDNTASLRVQLDEAQKLLAVRKTYDVLADKITRDSSLKPRHEQHVNIEKLRAEIEDLERESREHETAWMERREQMGRVVWEGMRLRRMLRGEPEETEENESADDAMLEIEGQNGGQSGMGTPRPLDDAPTPLQVGDSGAMTPTSTMREPGVSTPLRDIQNADISNDAVMGDGEALNAPTVEVTAPIKDGDQMDMT